MQHAPGSAQRALVAILGVVCALAAAGSAVADAGGNVLNAPPSFVSFSNLLGTAAAVGSLDALSGIALDANEEADMVRLRVATVSGPSLSATHTVTATDRATLTRPSLATEGWRVWNPVAGDGRISWEYEATYATAGTYVWQAFAKDEGTEQAHPATLTVAVTAAITVLQYPVDLQGEELVGSRWGDWTALPGATNVASTNFIKVINTGPKAAQSFVIDFTPATFGGVDQPAKTVPIDGNIQFAWWEDTTPQDSSPDEVSWASRFGTASATGSILPAFTAKGNIIYATYRLGALPAVLVDQEYGAGYTVTTL